MTGVQRAAARQSTSFSLCRITRYLILPGKPESQWLAKTPVEDTGKLTDALVYLFASTHSFQPTPPEGRGDLGTFASPGDGGGPFKLWAVIEADDAGKLRAADGEAVFQVARNAALLDKTEEQVFPFKDSGFEGGPEITDAGITLPDAAVGEAIDVYAVCTTRRAPLHLKSLIEFEGERPPYIQPFDGTQLQQGKDGLVWPVTDHVRIVRPLYDIYSHACNLVAAILDDELLHHKVMLWQFFKHFEKSAGIDLEDLIKDEFKKSNNGDRDFKEKNYDDVLTPRLRQKEEAIDALQRWVSTRGFTSVAKSYFDGNLAGTRVFSFVDELVDALCLVLSRCPESELGKLLMTRAFPKKDEAPATAMARIVRDVVLPESDKVPPGGEVDIKNTFKAVFKTIRTPVSAWSAYLTWAHAVNQIKIAELHNIAIERRPPWAPPADLLKEHMERVVFGVSNPKKGSITGLTALAFRKMLDNMLNDTAGGGPVSTLGLDLVDKSVIVFNRGFPQQIEVLDAQYRVTSPTVTTSLGKLDFDFLAKRLDIVNTALGALAFTEAVSKKNLPKKISSATALAASVAGLGSDAVKSLMARVVGEKLWKGPTGAYGVSVIGSALGAVSSAAESFNSFDEGDTDAAVAYFVAGAANVVSGGASLAIFIVGSAALPVAAPVVLIATIVGIVASIVAALVTDNDFEKLVKHSIFGTRSSDKDSDASPAWALDNGSRTYSKFTEDIAGVKVQLASAEALLYEFKVRTFADRVELDIGSFGDESCYDIEFEADIHEISSMKPSGPDTAGPDVPDRTKSVLIWKIKVRVVPSAKTVFRLEGQEATLKLTGSSTLKVVFEPADPTARRAMLREDRTIDVGSLVVNTATCSVVLDMFGNGRLIMPKNYGIRGADSVRSSSSSSISMLETLEKNRP